MRKCLENLFEIVVILFGNASFFNGVFDFRIDSSFKHFCRSISLNTESVAPRSQTSLWSLQDSKISSLERSLRDLEDEIQMLKSNGALSTGEREEEMKQMEVYRSHSKFMKNKVEPVAHAHNNCFVTVLF